MASLSAKRATLLLYLIGFGSSMPSAMVAPSLTAMAPVLGEGSHGVFLAQLVLSITSLAMLVTAPLTGLIANYIGHRRVIIIGQIVLMICGLPCLVLESAIPILILRFFVGVAAGAIITSTCVLIYKYFDAQQRDRVFGLMTAASGGAAVLSSVIAGFLVKSLGWHSVHILYLCAIPSIIAAQTLLYEPDQTSQNDNVHSPISSVFVHFLAIFGILLLMSSDSIQAVNPVTQMPFILKEQGLADPCLVSLMVTMLSGSQVGGSIIYAWACGRLTRNQMAAIMMSMFVMANFVLSLGGAFAFMLVASALMGLGNSWCKPRKPRIAVLPNRLWRPFASDCPTNRPPRRSWRQLCRRPARKPRPPCCDCWAKSEVASRWRPCWLP